MEITQHQVDTVIAFNKLVNKLTTEVHQLLKDLIGEKIFFSNRLSHKADHLGTLLDGFSSTVININDKKLDFSYELEKIRTKFGINFELYTGHPSGHRTLFVELGKVDGVVLESIHPDTKPLQTEFDLSYLKQLKRSHDDLEKQINHCRHELEYFL